MIATDVRFSLLQFYLLLFIVVLPFEVMAADIRPHISGSGSYRAVVIEGEIVPGDFETFKRIVKENQGKVSGVYLFTLGGDFYEAMKIGSALRSLELSSQVPMRDSRGNPTCEDSTGLGVTPTPKNPDNCTCASACFFIHIGAIHRGGRYLAVHRPFFGKGEFGKLSQSAAKQAFDQLQQKANSYMNEMGVPKHIQSDVLGTPSDKELLLDEKTIKTFFWLELPYRHEWILNKCSKLSDAEKQRSENYSLRLRRARNASNADLSKAEWDDLWKLQKIEEEERKCAIETNKKSRQEAYTKYFGVKPTDYGSHDFNRWSQASNYLGKQFYDLLNEGKFEEESFAGSNFLKRNATASAPHISLSDLQSKPRVVGWIGLVSPPNPSDEFIRRLVTSLEGAWGKSLKSDHSEEWSWDKGKFTAKLEHEPVSSEGPYMSLVIEKK